MYISQRCFGLHEGHLTEETNDIAKECGAWHVNYTDPCTGLKRGWFATLNSIHNREVEQNVMRKVQAFIGGFEALQKSRLLSADLEPYENGRHQSPRSDRHAPLENDPIGEFLREWRRQRET